MLLLVYNFLNKRHSIAAENGIAYDPITVVFFSRRAKIGCQRAVPKTAKEFVQSHLLNVLPDGGTHFGRALYAASKEIQETDKTCVVFLTDGEDKDSISNGKKASQWAYHMTHMSDGTLNKNVRMLVGYFGTKGTNVLDVIAKNGNTRTEKFEDRHQLNDFLVDVVARQATQFSLIDAT